MSQGGWVMWLAIVLALVVSAMEHTQNTAASVEEAYNTFRTLDPNDPLLIRALHRTGSNLSSEFDPPSYPTFATRSIAESIAPTDDEYDSMPQHSWSQYLWSWVPGTTSWQRSGSFDAYKYRPARLSTLVSSTDTVNDSLQMAIDLYSKFPEEAKETNGSIAEIYKELRTLPGKAIESLGAFNDLIIETAQDIRQLDYQIHSVDGSIHEISDHLYRLSTIMVTLQVAQQQYYVLLGRELEDWKSDSDYWKTLTYYCPQIETVYNKLQESFETLQGTLVKQIKCVVSISDERASFLIGLLESNPCVDREWIRGLGAVAVTCPNDAHTKLLMTQLLNILDVDQLIELDECLVNKGIISNLSMRSAIVSRIASLVGMSKSDFKKVLKKSKGRMEWAVSMAQFNLVAVSDEETEPECDDFS